MPSLARLELNFIYSSCLVFYCYCIFSLLFLRNCFDWFALSWLMCQTAPGRKPAEWLAAVDFSAPICWATNWPTFQSIYHTPNLYCIVWEWDLLPQQSGKGTLAPNLCGQPSSNCGFSLSQLAKICMERRSTFSTLFRKSCRKVRGSGSDYYLQGKPTPFCLQLCGKSFLGTWWIMNELPHISFVPTFRQTVCESEINFKKIPFFGATLKLKYDFKLLFGVWKLGKSCS